MRTMVVNHTRTKGHDGHSVQKLECKQTDRRTDGGDCITSRASNPECRDIEPVRVTRCNKDGIENSGVHSNG